MAKKEKVEEEQTEKKKFKAPKFSVKGLIAILPKLLIFLNIGGMALGGYLAYMGTIGLTPKVVREMEARKYLYEEEIFNDRPVTYSLEPFTVNLADQGDERIVQVKVTLEMLN